MCCTWNLEYSHCIYLWPSPHHHQKKYHQKFTEISSIVPYSVTRILKLCRKSYFRNCYLFVFVFLRLSFFFTFCHFDPIHVLIFINVLQNSSTNVVIAGPFRRFSTFLLQNVPVNIFRYAMVCDVCAFFVEEFITLLKELCAYA